MRFITVQSLENVEIKDLHGGVVYKAPPNKVFTVPLFTKFYIKGKYRRLKTPKHYKTGLLYFKPEKKVKFLGIRRIEFVENPNKCSIDVYTGTVLFDRRFFEQLNDVQRLFILLHETGHYFYYTEYKADTFATAMLLALGFTPAQVHAAINSTLMDEYRKYRNMTFLVKK